MARRAVEDGVSTIVATPHTMNGVYTNTFREVTTGVAVLGKLFSEHRVDLNLCGGADVHLCPNMLERILHGGACTINHAGKYILLELPSHKIPRGIKHEVFELKLNGITPIITHPERNASIQHDSTILHELVAMGALGQVTAMSLTGDFGTFVKDTAEMLLRRRLVHIIASDAHSSDSRPPVLSQAVNCAAEILGSYVEAERMVTGVPHAILLGEPIDILEPVTR